MHTQEMNWEAASHHLDGVMAFLSVARLGRLTGASDALGVNHSTVSRRIAGLEKSLGRRLLVRTPGGWELTEEGRLMLGVAEKIEAALTELTGDTGRPQLTGVLRVSTPEAFGAWLAAPALAELQRAHPDISVELLSATQPARQNRSGVDLEVVVGRPAVHRARAAWLKDYSLNLYATRAYLEQRGMPAGLSELSGHRLNYYVESMLFVDELDRATEALPLMRRSIASTSIHAHLAATLAGSGIGLLPDFAAESDPRLVRILAHEYSWPLSFWAVGREEALRNPLVQAAYQALRSHLDDGPAPGDRTLRITP